MLDHLKARGLDRSTLVVVTSDHGEEFLEHGSWEHQKTLYEEVIRIPLVLAGPARPSGTRAGASVAARRGADDPRLGGRARGGTAAGHQPALAAAGARGVRRDGPRR